MQDDSWGLLLVLTASEKSALAWMRRVCLDPPADVAECVREASRAFTTLAKAEGGTITEMEEVGLLLSGASVACTRWIARVSLSRN